MPSSVFTKENQSAHSLPTTKRNKVILLIYLDNAATTPMSAVAISAMTEVMQETYGNPSSIHGHGRQAGKLLREARQELAQLLGTKPQHIFFTSGGTEGNNTAIIGYCLRHQEQGNISSQLLLSTMLSLKRLITWFSTLVLKQPLSSQKIKKSLPSKFKRPYVTIRFWFLPCLPIMRQETYCPLLKLAKYSSNTQPPIMSTQFKLLEKSLFTQKNWALIFSPLLPINSMVLRELVFSTYQAWTLIPISMAETKNRKKRAGTENLAAIVGMVAALKEDLEKQEEHFQHVQNLETAFLAELEGVQYYLNRGDHHLPYVLNIGFPGQKNDLLLLRLDLAGISISTGSACTAGIVQSSHVLEAMYGANSERLKESVRISLSPENTVEDLHTLAKTLKEIIGG